MMNYLLILFLLTSCASFTSNKTTHFNIQLKKYNERFEKRLAMAHESLWVVDQNVKINPKHLKDNKFFAYLKDNDVAIHKQFTGIVIDQDSSLLKNIDSLKDKKIYLMVDKIEPLNLKNIDGVIIKGLYFKSIQNKSNNLESFIHSLKENKIDILSVEFSTSLHLMQKYQKFIKKHHIQGLITDSTFSGATFLHFVER